MKKSKYKLSDISIGDSVFFSIRGVNNQSKYWTVMNVADDGKIKVNMDLNDANSDLDINVGDIEILHQVVEAAPISKKK